MHTTLAEVIYLHFPRPGVNTYSFAPLDIVLPTRTRRETEGEGGRGGGGGGERRAESRTRLRRTNELRVQRASPSVRLSVVSTSFINDVQTNRLANLLLFQTP